jgi:hypothetical protein
MRFLYKLNLLHSITFEFLGTPEVMFSYCHSIMPFGFVYICSLGNRTFSRIYCTVLHWIWEWWTTVYDCLGFEILTAITMKSTVFWAAESGSLVKVHRRFGGTYHPNLQGRSKKSEIFYPEDGSDRFLRNVGWLLSDCTLLEPRRSYFSCGLPKE